MTSHRHTVDALLTERHGYPLQDFIADQREAGASWERTARSLYLLTDGIVDVTGKTLERWTQKGHHADRN